MATEGTQSMPIVLLNGWPCSGKRTIANELAKKLGTKACYIDSDDDRSITSAMDYTGALTLFAKGSVPSVGLKHAREMKETFDHILIFAHSYIQLIEGNDGPEAIEYRKVAAEATEYRKTADVRASKFIPVQLFCSVRENHARSKAKRKEIVADILKSKAKGSKLNRFVTKVGLVDKSGVAPAPSEAEFAEWRAKTELYPFVNEKDRLSVIITEKEPTAVAELIARHIQKVLGPQGPKWLKDMKI